MIGDGEGWLRMVQDRNLTRHTYNRVTAEQVSAQVEQRYLPCFRPCFRELRRTLQLRLVRPGAEEGNG